MTNGSTPQQSRRLNVSEKRIVPDWCYVPLNAQALPLRPVAYTVPEIAKICHVGRQAVYDAMNEGRLPHVKIGNRKVVGRKALERFLDGDN